MALLFRTTAVLLWVRADLTDSFGAQEGTSTALSDDSAACDINCGNDAFCTANAPAVGGFSCAPCEECANTPGAVADACKRTPCARDACAWLRSTKGAKDAAQSQWKELLCDSRYWKYQDSARCEVDALGPCFTGTGCTRVAEKHTSKPESLSTREKRVPRRVREYYDRYVRSELWPYYERLRKLAQSLIEPDWGGLAACDCPAALPWHVCTPPCLLHTTAITPCTTRYIACGTASKKHPKN